MKVFEYLDRISMMHKLVSRRVTGTPEEFARQLGVSRTSLYEMLDELRSRGAPILYSKSSKTFFYGQPYDIAITCYLRPLDCTEVKDSSGGYMLYERTFLSVVFPSYEIEVSAGTYC